MKLLVPRNKERMIKKKEKKKKTGDLGSSRNHLSSLIYYTFNTKIFIYRDFRESRDDYLILA